MRILNTISTMSLVICSAIAAASDIVPPMDAVDRAFVEKANQGSLCEIHSSELAIKRGMGTSEQSVAQQMIDDHTKANQALVSLAAKKGVELTTSPDKKHQDQLDQLGAVSDKDLAKAYIAMQLKAHKAAIDLFNDEAKDGKDADLRLFASDTLPTLKAHLAHVAEVSSKE
jgi:putative membrane protein